MWHVPHGMAAATSSPWVYLEMAGMDLLSALEVLSPLGAASKS